MSRRLITIFKKPSFPIYKSAQYSSKFQFISSQRCLSLPNHTKLKLPALSPTMETGNIKSWLLEEGQEFNEGDSLADVETDKTTVQWDITESENGYIAKLFVPGGQSNVKVGQLVAIIVEEKEDVEAFKNVTVEQLMDDGNAGAVSGAATTESSDNTKSDSSVSELSYPPYNLISLPALSPTMETGNIISWAIKVGDKVEENDILGEVETDKATVTFETNDEGYIAKLFATAGTKNIQVGAKVLLLVENLEDVDKFKDFTLDSVSQDQTPKNDAKNEKNGEKMEIQTLEQKQSSTQISSSSTQAPLTSSKLSPKSPSNAQISNSGSDRIKISPLAKQLAESENIELSNVVDNIDPTGPNGRFRKQDIEEYVQKLKSGEFVIQNKVAGGNEIVHEVQQLQTPTTIHPVPTDYSWTLQSKQTIPHYYLTMDINLTNANSLLIKLNNLQQSENISLSEIFLKAVSSACKNIPEGNSQWIQDQNIIRNFISVNIESNNNTCIYNVGNTGLSEISKKYNSESHRDPGVPTFSVYNFIDSKIDSASSIIKPGQACCLTIGGVRDEFTVGPENKPIISKIASVTLSCDHRLVDGAVGAEWLKYFKMYVEEPVSMLL